MQMHEQHNSTEGKDSSRVARDQHLIVSSPTAAMHESDSASTQMVSQLIYGEEVVVLESDRQWLHVRGKLDGYQGYSHRSNFSSKFVPTTHRVCNRATLLFQDADIKSPVKQRLTFGSRIAVRPETNAPAEFVQTNSGYYLWAAHCQGLETTLDAEPIEIAREHFLAAPYLWGGRSSDGLDCSGLVQLIASMSGKSLPRDSGDQEAALQQLTDSNTLASNDLVFWPGHVAWIVDAETVIHANASSMNVCEEPLEAVNQRAGNPSSFCRLG